MSDLRSFAAETEHSVVAPAFDVLVDRRRRRVRSRLVIAGVSAVVVVAVALGFFSTAARHRASQVPANTPVVSSVDWLAGITAFGLETMRSDGAEREVVVSRIDHDPQTAAWDRDHDVLVWTQYDDDNTRDVWVGDSRGKNARRIYDCVAPCEWAMMPAISPNGSTVAFVEWGAPKMGLVVVDMAASPSGRLVGRLDLGLEDEFQYPDWSPDGTLLLGTHVRVRATDAESTGEIVTVRVSDLRPEGTAVAMTPLVHTDQSSWDAAWSPDGSKVVYSQLSDATGEHVELWVVRADGTGNKRLTEPVPAAQGYDTPSWSSDGRSLYVVVRSPDNHGTLARVDLATGRTTVLKDRLGNAIGASDFDRG